MEQREFEVLCALEKRKPEAIDLKTVSILSKLGELRTAAVVHSLNTEHAIECTEDGKIRITEKGLEALEPYRVKRAVIIAAGFGARMVPITLNTPKPLVRVHGKRIIETLLDAVSSAGIEEVILVRGYEWEQFDALLYRYPNITFIQNDDFESANNISSVYMARDYLEQAYICEADLYVNNPGLIRKYEYATNYLGAYRDYTSDWCFKTEDGYIKELCVGSEDVHHMFGISYWTREDGIKLKKCVEETYRSNPNGRQLYWDEVALRLYIDQFHVQVRPCTMEDVSEIDTFQELKELDPSYNIEES